MNGTLAVACAHTPTSQPPSKPALTESAFCRGCFGKPNFVDAGRAIPQHLQQARFLVACG
eukprot:8406043-Alexandrium_andersonii.AAC.1